MEFALKSDRFYGACMAVALHAAVIAFGAMGLMRGIEYGMDASTGMNEVDLVAAPAPEVSSFSLAATPTESQSTRAADPEDIAEPTKAEPTPVQPSVKPVANALLTTTNLAGPLGDGSSAVPGTDATTIHRAGAGGAYFKPGYYRNPPPAYPEEARKLKQEGRVLLEIKVTTDGRLGGSRIKQSSGFPLLDKAALKGVQNWKFRPATIGGMRIEILADIPIRFQLK